MEDFEMRTSPRDEFLKTICYIDPSKRLLGNLFASVIKCDNCKFTIKNEPYYKGSYEFQYADDIIGITESKICTECSKSKLDASFIIQRLEDKKSYINITQEFEL